MVPILPVMPQACKAMEAASSITGVSAASAQPHIASISEGYGLACAYDHSIYARQPFGGKIFISIPYFAPTFAQHRRNNWRGYTAEAGSKR